MNQLIEIPRPVLSEPFPDVPQFYKCEKTGLKIPKWPQENIEWRAKLLKKAENDIILQRDLMADCKSSQLFWINTFAWTFHQFDEDPLTGQRFESKHPHMPFITWEIQDRLHNEFEVCLKKPEDILIDKSRKMGASWCCVNFLHWLWLFDPNSQLLEMSRTREYVDQPGNMKALFQKHDYVNEWLPDWMRPEECMQGERNRTKMHMKNICNGSTIDGESTTEHAARGDRRKVGLLDEFASVEYGDGMLTATRDACLMRIINSTVRGAGTAYSKLKN
jgi:hypothetical protein